MTVPLILPVSALRIGSTFTTLLTGRAGTVTGQRAQSDDGVPVLLEKPDEDKYLHREVRVRLEKVR